MHQSEGNAGSVTLHLSPNEFEEHLNRAGSVTTHLFPNEFDYHLNRVARIFDKFRASKARIDDDYLYSLYKSLIVAYTKSGVIPNFSKSSFVPSPLRTNTEFIPAFFPQAMSV